MALVKFGRSCGSSIFHPSSHICYGGCAITPFLPRKSFKPEGFKLFQIVQFSMKETFSTLFIIVPLPYRVVEEDYDGMPQLLFQLQTWVLILFSPVVTTRFALMEQFKLAIKSLESVLSSVIGREVLLQLWQRNFKELPPPH